MKKVNILPLFCLIGFWLISHIVFAQERGSAFYLLQQVQFFRTPNLSDALSNSNLSDLPVTFGSGVGGYGYSKNFVIGGEGTYFSGERKNNNTQTDIDGGWGYFYTGYRYAKNKLVVQPTAGIGFGGYTITVLNKENPITSLNGGTDRLVRVNNGNFLVHSGLLLEYAISSTNAIGLKSGYNFSLGKRAYESDFGDLNIEDPFSAFYINLTFSFTLK